MAILISPSGWGARVDYDKWTDVYTPDDKIILHHGGGPVPAGDLSTGGPAVEEDQLRRWESYHLGKGWRGIAYGFAVGQSGSLYRLRGFNSYGAHSGDLDRDGIPENSEGIPVLFILGTGQQPTVAALNSFERLRVEVLEKKVGRRLPLYGHGEINIISGTGTATSCPGTVRGLIRTDRTLPLAGTPLPKEENYMALLPELKRGAGFGLPKTNPTRVAVKRAQALLAIAGNIAANTFDANHVPDGLFGSGTEAAVKSFQRGAGISATGVVNEATWKALLGVK